MKWIYIIMAKLDEEDLLSCAKSTKNSTPLLSEREKKFLITTILFSLMCCGTIYLNIISFFPLYARENFPEKISLTMVSVCLSTFELAGVITSPINAIMISKIGRKTSLILGFSCIAVSTMGLGMLALIKTTEWRTFYYAAMAIRFV
jgi:MFS family permease